jgi:hypothetical protein
MDRAPATSSSHWYLSACSKDENAAEPAAGVDVWQLVAPAAIPSIAVIPRVRGPDRIRYPPNSTGFPLAVFFPVSRQDILINVI